MNEETFNLSIRKFLKMVGVNSQREIEQAVAKAIAAGAIAGTEFRFVSEGIHAALEQARAAADGRDVRLGGGVSTVRQYLRAALIDELHLAIRPVLLGSGEHLLNDIDMHALGYDCAKCVAGERATHVFLRKRA